ncbi:molybdopterin-dependent oxidoreductase [Caldalkalibacillus salinus]|uniref:molybdopterin-dependent oxidoreductase n=1 Tax=Caldalkalibacillus salinus TaxID=2803787 RepID=UPI001922C3CD|nr:molybdopterin-dependent oxidoreductase [Caldalkalibacillus salinus]
MTQREKKVKTGCPLNCWDACGFVVTTQNQKVVKVEGDPDHPMTKGKICGKGMMLGDRVNHTERILTPLKKVDGVFQEVTWSQALDDIADKMQTIKEEVGTTAVLHSHDYSNNGLLKNLDQRFFNCYGGITELVGSLCWGAGIEAQKVDFGSAYSHSPEDIVHSRSIVVWGRNITATNMHILPFVKKARKRGAQLIVIDPLKTGIAKMADTHITLRPGMDGAVALAIAKRLVDDGQADDAFLSQYTYGFDTFNKDVLATVQTDTILEQAGLTPDMFETLVQAYSEGKPTCTLMGLGLQRYSNGGQTIRSIDALVAVSGNIGIQGGGANYAQLAVGESFNTTALTRPDKRKQHRTFTRMTQAEDILAANDPPIKMLFVTRGNPVVQVPNTNLVKKAFEQIETKVVVDQFLTDTAQLADYVLPCTTVFEEEDLYYASMFHNVVTYGQASVPPYGEAKPDRWIWTELANRLGFGDEFDYTVDEWLEMGLSLLNEQGVTLEVMKEKGAVKLPISDVPWFNKQFTTPSGKYEFYSLKLEREGKEPMVQLQLPHESKWRDPERYAQYPYTMLSIHPQKSLHSQHFHLVSALQEPRIDISTSIAERENLNEGDLIRLYNDRGSIEGIVKIVPGIHADTIRVDEGRWGAYGGSPNQLTPDTISDVGLGSTLYDCLVGIEKL